MHIAARPHPSRALLLGAALLCSPRLAQAARPAAPLPPETIATADMTSLRPIPVFAAPAKPVGFQTAPTPDADFTPPVGVQDSTPRVSPTLYTRREQFRGDGYSPGSTAQDAQESLLKPAAGVMVKVPLD